MRENERGDSLIEAVVCTAIVAIAVAGITAGLLSAAHRFGPDPVTTALQQTVADEMRIAADLAKYQGATLTSITIATTAPLPSASPLPIHLSLLATTAADASVTLTLTATSDADPTKAATLTQHVSAPAPVPGARISASVNGSAPQ